MKLAIIGAGVAGLAAARMLRQRRPDLAITIYEKSRGLGGRAVTRRRDGYIFDHGAQYMKAPTPELEQLLTAELAGDDLVDIGRPVWTFDGAGVIAEGDPAQNAGSKWTYRHGLNRLGKLLGAGLDIQRETQIGRIGRTTNDERQTTDQGADPSSFALRPWSHYELFDTQQQKIAAADLVLFTPPAPQTADILVASDLDAGTKAALLAELAHASYRRCISLALAYERPITRPFYALVNIDRAHPISWLALEHAKAPERCPPDHSLLIAQMAARWSHEHWDTPADQLEHLVADQVDALLSQDTHVPLWSDVQRWRYALPDSAANFEALNASGSGLFFAGDYTSGQGRLHLAIESGWHVASAIERMLEELGTT
jgi:predicted NAD/FAD-dependent oxidoreductase